jgi:DNA-binding transcriptional LysR family regulator
MPTMTLQQLRVLVAVVERRSFTRGARAVFMTQSAASQHVRSLEHTVGTPLVERIGGEVVPTHAGEGLVRYARELLRLAADAERFVAALRDGRAGRLALGACGSAVYLVPALVSGFRAAHPDVDVTLEVLPRQALREAVARGAVDAALMSGPVRPGGGADLAAQPLCADRLVLAVPPASPLLSAAALAPYPLERAAAQPLVAPAESAPSWRLVERWALAHGVELRPALRLDHVDTVKRAVEAGIGVAFLSAWVIEREVALGTLRVVPLAPPPPARHYELVRRAAGRVDAPLQTFLRFAPDYLGRRLPPHVTDGADAAPERAPAGGRLPRAQVA